MATEIIIRWLAAKMASHKKSSDKTGSDWDYSACMTKAFDDVDQLRFAIA